MVNCKGKPKCYQSKNKKKCSTPNSWIVFLRTHVGQFKSLKEASAFYKNTFKPKLLENIMIKLGGDKSIKSHKRMHKILLCREFYKHLKTEKKLAAVRKQLKQEFHKGVKRLLKDNSVPEALDKMGAKHTATALKKKQAAVEKADDSLQQAEKVEREKKRKADRDKEEVVRRSKRLRVAKAQKSPAASLTSERKRKTPSASTRSPKRPKTRAAAAAQKKKVEAAKGALDMAKLRAQRSQREVKAAGKKVEVAKKLRKSARQQGLPANAAQADNKKILKRLQGDLKNAQPKKPRRR